jgi:short-subunit dehydrogenase
VSVTTVFPSAVDTPFYILDEKMRRRLLRCGVMMRSEEVVRKALTAMFRSRKRSLPGFITKLEAAICAVLPSWVLLLVMKLPAVKRVLERV